MADQWYYRMFGHDFGPVSFEELKQLAELGSISSDDEVRQATTETWSTAGSVSALGLSTTIAPRSIVAAIADAPVQNTPTGANDWYYMFHGQEMGPIGFDEIIAFAEQGQLEASDEVRLGASGKWRRVGSIGRLVAVLPYHEPAVPEAMPVQEKPQQQTATTTSSSPILTVPPVSAEVPSAPDAALIQAQATYSATDRVAKNLVSWALAPNVDPAWWGWIGGAERGPVGFVQIYDWAMAGQLQAADFVKNGMYGQYVHAANVPGLFNAVSLVVQAKQALEAAEALAAAKMAKSNPVVNAMAASVVASTPVKQPRSEPKLQAVSSATVPVKKSSADIVTEAERVAPTKPVEPVRPIEVRTPESQPAPAGPRPSSSSFAVPSAAVTRPVVVPPRPSASMRSSSGPGALDAVKDPKVLGGLGAVVVLSLLAFGWQYLPLSSGKDIAIYKETKSLIDDIRSARAQKTTDFGAFKSRAQELKDKYVPTLKAEASNARPAKQSLLFAIRDELPRMMSGDLSVESASEKSAIAHLQEAAKRLGIK